MLWAEGQVELFFNFGENLGQPHSELSLISMRNLNLRISTLVTYCRLVLEGGTSKQDSSFQLREFLEKVGACLPAVGGMKSLFLKGNPSTAYHSVFHSTLQICAMEMEKRTSCPRHLRTLCYSYIPDSSNTSRKY